MPMKFPQLCHLCLPFLVAAPVAGALFAAEPVVRKADPSGRVAVPEKILSATPADSPRAPGRKVKIVVLQAGTEQSKNGNPGLEANFDCLVTQAREAAKSRPDLIVFPEYAMTGWPYPQEDIINGIAEKIPGEGPWYRRYEALSRELKTPLVGWLVESDAGRLYNCAFILDAQGAFVGKYRKVNANLGEQTWWGWSQGESLAPIELNGVRYGLSICADMESPEPMRCSELLGADVIIHQSISDDMEHLIPARVSDSGLPIVMSIFRGGSYALDASGTLLGKLPADKPGWKAFELQPFQPLIGAKYGGLWDVRKGHMNLRNPEAYRVLTDPATRPSWTSVFYDATGQPQSRDELKRRFKGRYDAHDPELYHTPLVRFAAPWTSPFHVDPDYPCQLVNREGEHLFILNKTAWAYFSCRDPQGVLDRARAVGANVIRVTLEGVPYPESLGLDFWPWGGTRHAPDWNTFDTAYWERVEQRVRLAGENGVGLDVVFYFTLKPSADEVAQQRPFWEETLRRLGKYANVLTWEIANEYIGNESFQDQAAAFLKACDPYRRPVCSSDGTTDDVLWPDKPWMDLAINHTCTSSTERHDLRDWYLAISRNTRSHGKPAFVNETGREKRHQNDDGVHRRKQSWLGNAAGCFWTFHSWGGCEGIDSPDYMAPGEEFVRPMVEALRALPLWRMDPNFTACVVDDSALVQASLAAPDRSIVLTYVCATQSGQAVSGATARLVLPNGEYQITFRNPADATVVDTRKHVSPGFKQGLAISLPDFNDDLAVFIEKTRRHTRTVVPGTQ